MNELYFIPPHKVNHRTVDNIIEGGHIVVDGYQFEQLNTKPKGRRISRRLRGLESETQIIIYS